MKKTNDLKLSLSRQTIRTLTDDDVAAARGGAVVVEITGTSYSGQDKCGTSHWAPRK